MQKVYVLHRNHQYEFGEVLGVYAALPAAIKAAEAARAEKNYGDLEVSEWGLQDGQDACSGTGEAVWASYEKDL
ncbi:hypothetical protein [Pusillimonas sp. NJUB218]|uniref:hypothetical protein n=1 Tax=Pusillimonas sp. NJUB218 TaxID=2023230 RepID=UPI000F4B484F|nr:hypothetical protein [Pusillimonas sp. NJUB218]ROT45019.1 hypothetical protein CHR62_09210 [Pusillimonas sp. NJUB218]